MATKSTEIQTAIHPLHQNVSGGVAIFIISPFSTSFLMLFSDLFAFPRNRHTERRPAIVLQPCSSFGPVRYLCLYISVLAMAFLRVKRAPLAGTAENQSPSKSPFKVPRSADNRTNGNGAATKKNGKPEAYEIWKRFTHHRCFNHRCWSRPRQCAIGSCHQCEHMARGAAPSIHPKLHTASPWRVGMCVCARCCGCQRNETRLTSPPGCPA